MRAEELQTLRAGIMARILLTHAEEARTHYYGEEALARLRELHDAIGLVTRRI